MVIIQRVKVLLLFYFLFCQWSFASSDLYPSSIQGAMALGPKGFQRLLVQSFEVVLPALEEEIKSQSLEIPNVEIMVPIKSELLLENIRQLTKFENALERAIQYCDDKCLEYLKDNSIELDDLPDEIKEDTGFNWRSIITNRLSDQRKLEFNDFVIHDVSFSINDSKVDDKFEQINLKLRIHSFHISGNVNFYDLQGNIKLRFPIVINLHDQVESIGFDLKLDVLTNTENKLLFAIDTNESRLLIDYPVLNYQLEVHTPEENSQELVHNKLASESADLIIEKIFKTPRVGIHTLLNQTIQKSLVESINEKLLDIFQGPLEFEHEIFPSHGLQYYAVTSIISKFESYWPEVMQDFREKGYHPPGLPGRPVDVFTQQRFEKTRNYVNSLLGYYLNHERFNERFGETTEIIEQALRDIESDLVDFKILLSHRESRKRAEQLVERIRKAKLKRGWRPYQEIKPVEMNSTTRAVSKVELRKTSAKNLYILYQSEIQSSVENFSGQSHDLNFIETLVNNLENDFLLILPYASVNNYLEALFHHKIDGGRFFDVSIPDETGQIKRINFYPEAPRLFRDGGKTYFEMTISYNDVSPKNLYQVVVEVDFSYDMEKMALRILPARPDVKIKIIKNPEINRSLLDFVSDITVKNFIQFAMDQFIGMISIPQVVELPDLLPTYFQTIELKQLDKGLVIRGNFVD